MINQICICGGGSLGHVCLAVLSNQKDIVVNLLTSKPEKWSHEIIVTDFNNRIYKSKINIITNDPAKVIPQSDLILLCLPGYAIKDSLDCIKPFLSESTLIGSIVSSTGFFFFAHEVLENGTKLFGFQRVPYIARTNEYGRNANLLGYKSSLKIAIENVCDVESVRAEIENLFNTPCSLLKNFYEAALSNSNPILHTGRLYSMWRNWDGKPYDRCPLFYKDWTMDASQFIIDMDKEFMSLLDKLPMNKSAIPTLLDYYESHNAESLTAKIKSIKAFQTIKAPMKKVTDGWIPDFASRYFTEDFPFGLFWIKEMLQQNNIESPVIDKVYEWGMKMTKTK